MTKNHWACFLPTMRETMKQILISNYFKIIFLCHFNIFVYVLPVFSFYAHVLFFLFFSSSSSFLSFFFLLSFFFFLKWGSFENYRLKIFTCNFGGIISLFLGFQYDVNKSMVFCFLFICMFPVFHFKWILISCFYFQCSEIP